MSMSIGEVGGVGFLIVSVVVIILLALIFFATYKWESES